jgi:heterodisulfide reductase subunit D
MSDKGQTLPVRVGRISEEDYLSCIRCGACSYTCPVYRVKLLQSFSPRGRVALLRAASRGEAELGEGFGTRFYSCTLCAACTEVCPSGVKVDELLLEVRAALAGQGSLPPALANLSQTIQQQHNVSGDDNALRLIWTENLRGPARGKDRAQAEVVYFVGCVSSFFPRAYSIPQAFVQTLEAAGVDYALLGGEEWCCGYPLLANGLAEDARETIRHNVARVLARGARKVVFTCPSCYHTWKHTYPQIAGEEMASLEILHATEYLAELIDEGRLLLREVKQTVAYHDPCDLGRKSQIYEAPRRVLRGIPGLTLVEMADNRETALCCGGGGNLESYDPDLVAALSARRLAQAQRVGADAIVSACQQCERTLSNACRRQKVRMRVLDVCEIVWDAVR